MKVRSILFLLILFASVVPGCTPKAKYERLLKRELASGIRHDSIFFGIYLGMEQKDFYLHCWELNHKGLIRQGPSNATVEYNINTELKYPAVMEFYPKFNKGKISEMPVQIKYKGWAPWNKKLSADSLETDILHWYERVYGGGFISVRHPKQGVAYVKVNGNRRITIIKQNDLYVWTIFRDMLVKPESHRMDIPDENVPIYLRRNTDRK